MLVSRWFGITVFRFPGKGPRVWAVYVRVGRKRKIEIVYR